MNKKFVPILLIVVLAALAVGFTYWRGQNQPALPLEPPVANVQNQATQPPPTLDTAPVLTAGWKIYRNEEYGYEIKYPGDWQQEVWTDEDSIDGKIIAIYTSKYREGLPEGGTGIHIQILKDDLDSFIKKFNSRDITGGSEEIVKVGEYTLGNIKGTHLVAGTAIGIGIDYVFITKNGKNYLISFMEEDLDHMNILSTFKFLK